MTALIIALYALSVALLLAGLYFTIKDIRAVAARFQQYQTRGITLPLRAHGRARASGSAEFSGGSPPTVEQRVQRLEQELDAHLAGLNKREDALRTEFGELLRGALEDAELVWRQRLEALRALVAPPPADWLRRYLGPLLVAIGIAAGAAAGVLGTVR